MNGKKPVIFVVLLVALVFVAILIWFLFHIDAAVLTPKGVIAQQQRDLLIFSTLLMLIVIVPVFVLLFFISWKYRASNKTAKYRPEFNHSTALESLWWGIPFVIIVILSVITWKSSHQLDPYRPIDSVVKPVTIQVVALEWKWLFIYPEENVASVNYIAIPEDTPINFQISADAPMNSFWIPQLAGQVYAMNGMTTKLHVMASEPGQFKGVSSNISGEGFASMRFTVDAMSDSGYRQWVSGARSAQKTLSTETYNTLAQPSIEKNPLLFNSAESDLFSTILDKYMGHGMTHKPSSEPNSHADHEHSMESDHEH